MKRRNLSGIYIFEKFEDEEKRQPTCFEDCTEATQNAWLDTLNAEALKHVAKALAKTINHLGDTFGIVAGENNDE